MQRPDAKSNPKDNIATPAPNPNWIEIKAPMAGKFYRYPDPDESPYVELGDYVRKGQTIGLIKLMYEIEANASGQVMEILVQDGEFVRYDQPLMLIDPIYAPAS